ncbi:MAG: glycoside hydrolase family 2 protein [Actinomycetota bacterium]|nr:glycoside hydrolase family 2 protein [Actinomycetota bacterium]
MRHPVDQPWTLTATGGAVPDHLRGVEVPVTVPGVVHTDLLAAGLVPDPYLDENEAALQWIGRTSWRYRTRLHVAPPTSGEQVELVFDGLDTVAEVRLDDQVLGSAANMHRPHRYDVTALVTAVDDDGAPGQHEHELIVDFAAQLDAAEEMSRAQGPRIHTNEHPFNAVRKMACNFGWDWGPDLVTAGIWRPVHVDRWRTARLAVVRPLVTVDGATGRAEVHVAVDRGAEDEQPLTVSATVSTPDGTPHVVSRDIRATERSTVLALEVPDVALWWPIGYGNQPLHHLEVTLHHAGVEVDRWERRIGFRTVTLDTEPDDHGTPFVLSVNDRPVLVKGANWIPDDCFPHRVDRARYAARIDDAVDAGMNLLRVWGGGIYEAEVFYDLCDERGVLVWQDFLFACAAYAEEAPLRDEVVTEATEAVTRLSPHPSLVVWNGNNENLWGHEDWHWAEQLGDLTWGRGYYLDVLPELVARLDPTRPYSPGSPWSFDERLHPNDPDHGTMHIWDVWNERDYTAYRDYVPRFVSEFGYQGPPTWATLTRAVHDTPTTPSSPAMSSHQKAVGGDEKLTRGLRPHLDVPADDHFEDWHWAMQVQQARAVAYGLEHLRSWHPVCSGAIVWQLNDCWPVTSWAAVDGDGRRKPLWFALRQAYAARLLTVQPRAGALVLAVGNDTDAVWSTQVAVRRLDLDGSERAVTTLAVEVPPRSTVTVPLPVALCAEVDVRRDVLVAQAGDHRALWFFAEDKDLGLTHRWASSRVERVPGGYDVHVTAHGLQRDVCLLVDKVDPDATVDDAMVTLLPGESRTFHVTSSRRFDPTALLEPRVLRSTNQLVHSPERSDDRHEHPRELRGAHR